MENKFNRSIKPQSKIFFDFADPLHAFLFMMLSPRKRFIREHFVLATHYLSAILMYFLFAAYLVNLPVMYLVGENSGLSSGIGVSLICLYLSIAFRRFYKVPLWWSALCALAIVHLRW